MYEWLSGWNWEKILVYLGSGIAIVLGILKIKEKLKKRPNLQIPEENIEMEVRKESGVERLRVTFRLYNKKTWWNRFLISRAFNFIFKGTLVHKNGETLPPANDPVTAILYPGKHITHGFGFRYDEDFEELIIQVASREPKIVLVKYLKISEYLTRDES